MQINDCFVYPIHHNNGCIAFPEWISLFTLSLAPLIVHIISGTPPTSYLSFNRPRWHENLGHYNPTSIIWRYAVITDRRIRALSWNQNDLAATNAVFWTAKGWNSSEQMVSVAAPYCIRRPEHTHVKILSMSTVKTIVTTLQGLMASYSVIGRMMGVTTVGFNVHMGVDMIFYPIASIGLLRLCAAAWLADDFEYATWNNIDRGTIIAMDAHYSGISNSLGGHDPFMMMPFDQGQHFLASNSSWTSRLFRLFYLLMVGSGCGFSLVFIVLGMPSLGVYKFTTTTFLVSLFYFMLTSVSFALYLFYFLRGELTTTLLPCISKVWYKLYTLILFAFMFVLVIIASIETNKGPDGNYRSVQLPLQLHCISQSKWFAIAPTAEYSRLVSDRNKSVTHFGQNYSSTELIEYPGNSSLSDKRYWLYNFTGYCVGQF